MRPAYQYAARVVSVYDGDSVTADIDLGFRITVRVKLRLLGIDAPEMGTPEGTAARDFLRHLLAGRGPVVVRTYKDPGDKYGRWLAELYFGEESVADVMLEHGHAVPYVDGARTQTTPAAERHEWVPCPRHMIPTDCGTCCDLSHHDPIHSGEGGRG